MTVATAVDLARLWGITRQAVNALARRGIIKRQGRGFDRDESTLRYCAHLRGLATGRGGEAAITSATAERARLAKAQADSQELKNAALRGAVLDAGAVEREWADILRTVRAGMLAVPSRAAQRLPHLTTHDVAAIDHEVRAVLTGIGAGGQ
jgi:terminase small subunit / prophage DNA-packing protein